MNQKEMQRETVSQIAIVPGSFDPITKGHVELVRQALERYDYVYLAVMINAEKQYLFSLDERKQIAEAALQGWDRVEVVSSEGMLWKLAEDLGATKIVKGYRNEVDLAYENKMATFNRTYNPSAETVLLPSPKELNHISSSVVRQRIQNGEDLQEYLPPNSMKMVEKLLSQKLKS